jgi:hypothetical protein
MKMAVFWVVAPTRLHGATTQKTAIFMKGRNRLEDVGVDEMIILIFIRVGFGGVDWIHLAQDRYR